MRTTSIVAFAILSVAILAVSVRAAITVVPPVTNNTFGYSFVANWTFDSAADEEASILGAWGVLLESPANLNGINKTLTLNARHLITPHLEPPSGDETVDLGEFARPAVGTVRKAKAQQFTHGTLGHKDIVRVLAQVPAVGDGAITTTGEHTRKPLSRWSALGLNGQIKVKAKTDTGREYTPQNGNPQNVVPRDHASAGLNVDADGIPLSPHESPAEYTVVGAVGGATFPADPLTETTLSFLGSRP
jgi:hypothetical protein